jgi:D-alanine-D-alanine ligase-like ATP-grasp enzyme
MARFPDYSVLEEWRDDVGSGCLFRAATARGVPAQRIIFSPRRRRARQQWLQLKIGTRRYVCRKGVIYVSRGPFGWWINHINRSAISVTPSKHKTNSKLREAGLSVPDGRAFARDEIGPALEYFDLLGRNACVKADNGRKGVGVFPRITNQGHFRSAFLRVAQEDRSIVVEKNVPGDTFRYMVIDGKIAGVRLGRPANVVGDGVRTIAELVVAKNVEIRLANIPGAWVEVNLDDEADRILTLSGLSRDSRLAEGHRAFLRATSNVASGGDAVCNPSGLHPSYEEEVLKAVAAIPELVLTGVDIMIADYRQPAAPTNHWFLDLNSAPGISTFHFPREGEPSDIAGQIMDWLLAGGPR